MTKFSKQLEQEQENTFSFPEAFESFFGVSYQNHALQTVQQRFLNKIEQSQPLDVFTKYYVGGQSTFFELLEISKTHVDALNLQDKYQILFDQCIATSTIDPVFAVSSYYEMLHVEGYDEPAHAFVSIYHMAERYFMAVHAKQGEISTKISDYDYVDPENILSLDNEEYNKLATGLLSLNYARNSLNLDEKMFLNYWRNFNYDITWGKSFNETNFVRSTYKYFSNMVIGKELFV